MINFQKEKRFSLASALGWIVLSVFIINAPFALGIFTYKKWKQKRLYDKKYHLVALFTKCVKGEALSCACLAEWLELSVDAPLHFDQFNVLEKQAKLRSQPVIVDAMIQKISPGSVFVTYQLREPVAYLADYENAALDLGGNVFPFKPFYTPKKLPKIRLGLLLDQVYGSQIKDQKLQTALSLLKELEERFAVHVLNIDVSKIQASSAGREEIVVELEELREEAGGVVRIPRLLRLSSKAMADGLNRYKKLLKEEEKEGFAHKKVVDLRLNRLGFLSD